MNQLSIQCTRQTNEDGGIYYDVEFFVDGRPFLEMVKEFESAFAGDLAGNYYNICYIYYTEDFLLGKTPSIGKNKDKIPLLGCTCGITECWPLATRVRVVESTVVWDAFEQPFRTWDYSGFGPFVFDLEQYRQAISVIPILT